MIQKDINGFDRILEFVPAFDKRNDEPKKNYGIGNVLMRFVLKGKDGAVQFYMSTGMALPEIHKELFEKNTEPAHERLLTMEVLTRPMGYDLGYHSRKPMYDGHECMGSKKRDGTKMINVGDKELEMPNYVDSGTCDPCEFLDGAPCYYDGSGLAADPVLNIFLSKGEDAVWQYLEKYYADIFK